MIKAVLFDLDETLLDIDLNAYLRLYAVRHVQLLAQVARRPALTLALPFARATSAMVGERDDDLTNAAFFARRFGEATGIPLDDPVIASCVECFDRVEFNPTAAARVRHAPMKGAREAVRAALGMGLVVALATNPTFPLACTRERMRWAGVDDLPFALVTSIETAHRTKPSARYYREVARALGCEPAECLMVGNDPRYDFPEPDETGLCPIPTLYVGERPDERAAWSGSMAELADALPAIVRMRSQT